MVMMKTVFVRQGLDPQNSRNQCKLIWDSASAPRPTGPRAIRSQKSGPPNFMKGSGTGGPLAKVQITPRSANLRSASTCAQKVKERNNNIVASQAKDLMPSHSKIRRRSISDIIATRMSRFEDRLEERRETKDDLIIQAKRSVEFEMKIQFDDHATTTFEYEGEESALQNYLLDHPDEKDDVIKQDEEVNGVESSTDELLHDSPRSPVEPDTHMKSNTVIGHSAGALTSYKSKILTQDFQFGMSTQEPEPVYNNNYSAPSADDDSFNLLPAADTDLDAFSAETGKSDMLF